MLIPPSPRCLITDKTRMVPASPRLRRASCAWIRRALTRAPTGRRRITARVMRRCPSRRIPASASARKHRLRLSPQFSVSGGPCGLRHKALCRLVRRQAAGRWPPRGAPVPGAPPARLQPACAGSGPRRSPRPRKAVTAPAEAGSRQPLRFARHPPRQAAPVTPGCLRCAKGRGRSRVSDASLSRPKGSGGLENGRKGQGQSYNLMFFIGR